MFPLGGSANTLYIKYLYGYPLGDVRPENSITRAEAAAIFHRLLANTNKDDYVDAPPSMISTTSSGSTNR